jgi:hypothetical protein
MISFAMALRHSMRWAIAYKIAHKGDFGQTRVGATIDLSAPMLTLRVAWKEVKDIVSRFCRA